MRKITTRLDWIEAKKLEAWMDGHRKECWEPRQAAEQASAALGFPVSHATISRIRKVKFPEMARQARTTPPPAGEIDARGLWKIVADHQKRLLALEDFLTSEGFNINKNTP